MNANRNIDTSPTYHKTYASNSGGAPSGGFGNTGVPLVRLEGGNQESTTVNSLKRGTREANAPRIRYGNPNISHISPLAIN
jgi:hypothetical protein